MSKVTVYGAVILAVVSLLLIVSGSRGTYKQAWNQLLQTPGRTPASASSGSGDAAWLAAVGRLQ